MAGNWALELYEFIDHDMFFDFEIFLIHVISVLRVKMLNFFISLECSDVLIFFYNGIFHAEYIRKLTISKIDARECNNLFIFGFRSENGKKIFQHFELVIKLSETLEKLNWNPVLPFQKYVSKCGAYCWKMRGNYITHRERNSWDSIWKLT